MTNKDKFIRECTSLGWEVSKTQNSEDEYVISKVIYSNYWEDIPQYRVKFFVDYNRNGDNGFREAITQKAWYYDYEREAVEMWRYYGMTHTVSLRDCINATEQARFDLVALHDAICKVFVDIEFDRLGINWREEDEVHSL